MFAHNDFRRRTASLYILSHRLAITGYNICIRLPSTRVWLDEEDVLRSSLVESFYETLGYCFGKVLLETLGPKVQAAVYHMILRSGIRKKPIPNNFTNVAH